jgi:endonuclease I
MLSPLRQGVRAAVGCVTVGHLLDAQRPGEYSGRVNLDAGTGPLLGATEVDLQAALDDLEAARERPYFDEAGDAEAARAYYDGARPDDLTALVTSTHERAPRYAPARELYPWVDLQPDGALRSLYTGEAWDPAELIRADFDVLRARSVRLQRLSTLGGRTDDEVLAEVEAELPYNCEHVVPQSWFAKAEPMRGDLHHLFACESRCNSFRGNTCYAEFADWPETEPDGRQAPAAPRPDLPRQSPGGVSPGTDALAIRSDCGKREADGFEPAEGKGAAARAVLYFLLRYPATVTADEMPAERLGMVLAWHRSHDVDVWERHRNAAVHERQGNRNPFVDHPGWVDDALPAIARGVRGGVPADRVVPPPG